MLRRLREIGRSEGVRGIAVRSLRGSQRRLASALRETRARGLGSFHSPDRPVSLKPRLDSGALDRVELASCIPATVAAHYLEHRFDILGSGWTRVYHGMSCRGLEGWRYEMGAPVHPDQHGHWLKERLNRSNVDRGAGIWRLIDPGYVPIDWQLDIKSGFRWSERVWAPKLAFGDQPGVDVKVPWELARMQHLPQLALRASAMGKDSPEAHRLAREVRNQILDFVATNPPGFGVNWLCRMDVAIRIANWLLAWDVLHAAGLSCDPDAAGVLAQSTHDHGRFIAGDLEWSDVRANHYLAHVCGLAFVGAYLDSSGETDRWLALAARALEVEVLRQFHADGGNFEGSVAYHRLSAEMVLYTTALLLGLPEARRKSVRTEGVDLDALTRGPLARRLASIVEFFTGVLKPDGEFPQIGDNDSGRFFKIQPVYLELTVRDARHRFVNLEQFRELPDDAICHMESSLDGRHLLAAAAGLGVTHQLSARGLEDVLVSGLAHGGTLTAASSQPHPTATAGATGTAEGFAQLWDALRTGPSDRCEVLTVPVPRHVDAPLVFHAFADFGCYIFKHDAVYLALRCVTRRDAFLGSHAHADQLSLVLDVAGRRVVTDPGTYIYTALPEQRRRYRAEGAHFTPLRVRQEVPRSERDVFAAVDVLPATVDHAGTDGARGWFACTAGDAQVLVRIEPTSVQILHWFGAAGDGRGPFVPLRESPGYGLLDAGRV